MSGQSTSTQQQNTSSSQNFPQWTQNAGQNLYQGLASQYPSWTPYSGPTSAAPTSAQNTAQNYATGAATGQSGPLASVINSINPSLGPGQYMNPYVQATLNPTLQNLQTANAQENQQTGAAATLSGAYGGTGQGVQTALNNYFTGQNVANASGQAYSNAYNSAIQQQQNSLQDLLGAAGAQTSAAGLLSGLGAQEQNVGQTGIQNAINLNQQNQTMPLSQGLSLASILSGIPKDTWGNSQSFSQTQTPNNVLYALMGSLLGNSGLVGGSNPTTGASTGLTGLLSSDVRLKTDIAPVGKLYDGQNVYAFRYKGDPTPRIGLMAQEVEKTRPDAVHTAPSGLKAVDYGKATEGSRLIDIINRIAA
jgi:hypothetical protein